MSKFFFFIFSFYVTSLLFGMEKGIVSLEEEERRILTVRNFWNNFPKKSFEGVRVNYYEKSSADQKKIRKEATDLQKVVLITALVPKDVRENKILFYLFNEEKKSVELCRNKTIGEILTKIAYCKENSIIYKNKTLPLGIQFPLSSQETKLFQRIITQSYNPLIPHNLITQHEKKILENFSEEPINYFNLQSYELLIIDDDIKGKFVLNSEAYMASGTIGAMFGVFIYMYNFLCLPPHSYRLSCSIISCIVPSAIMLRNYYRDNLKMLAVKKSLGMLIKGSKKE